MNDQAKRPAMTSPLKPYPESIIETLLPDTVEFCDIPAYSTLSSVACSTVCPPERIAPLVEAFTTTRNALFAKDLTDTEEADVNEATDLAVFVLAQQLGSS